MDNSILTYCSISIAVLSLFFTLFGNFWCFYVTSTLTASAGATGETLGSADVYFGIWSRQHYMYSVQSTTDGTYIYAIPGKVFSSTVNLSAPSMAQFVEQLINVSAAEISGDLKKDA